MRPTRLRVRRAFRRRKNQIATISEATSKHLDKNLDRRLGNLAANWRFITGWSLLLLLLVAGVAWQTARLGRYYLVAQPVDGGVFIEGQVGRYTSASPLFANSPVDQTISQLVFSGLLRYDESGDLVPDLAESISPDDRAQVYTAVIRKNATWHDGRPVVAADVVYTIQAIQNPATRSPFKLSWDGVQVEALDERTVRFTLPNPLSSFPHSLTVGIVPKHVLQDVPLSALRINRFSTQSPIGSGPFRFGVVREESGERQRVQLTPYESFHRGMPRLGSFYVQTYPNAAALESAIQDRDVTAAVVSEPPKDPLLTIYSAPLASGWYLFLNTSRPPLNDVLVRRALVSATNTAVLRQTVGYPITALNSPLLSRHLGYDPAVTQLPFSIDAATNNLQTAGWVITPGQTIAEKNGQPLQLRVRVPQDPLLLRIATAAAEQWRSVGVNAEVIPFEAGDSITGQSLLVNHDFDVLLFGIDIGADPDVYVYWHGSQAVPGRFNFSEYKSSVANLALESGRTRIDPATRGAKYRPLLEAWRNDAPAVGIAQPQFIYAATQPIYNFSPDYLVTPSSRFAEVNKWQILRERQIMPR